MSKPGSDSRVSAVVLTHNRADEVLRTVAALSALPEQPPLIVVDNGSTDGTAARLRAEFPAVTVIRLDRNAGAAARNIGAAATATPYIAFCDDDTAWAPGSLAQAGDLLDAHPAIALLTARVLVGAEGCEDPACRLMAESELPSDGLPGRAVLGFLAGACVFRRQAFAEAGGYEPRLFIGGEEALLALDLLARGWRLVYCAALTVHHFPSAKRDSRLRRRLLARNALWVAWLRRPPAGAALETGRVLSSALRDPAVLEGAVHALSGIAWVLRRRRPVPPHVAALLSLAGQPAPGAVAPAAPLARPTEP
jgi:GT2 family glycosyltransferase